MFVSVYIEALWEEFVFVEIKREEYSKRKELEHFYLKKHFQPSDTGRSMKDLNTKDEPKLEEDAISISDKNCEESANQRKCQWENERITNKIEKRLNYFNLSDI